MPTVLRIGAYRYHFYSNEGNEPPHVHVTGDGGEMKVWLKPVLVASAYKLSAKKQREIVDIIKKNRGKIVEAWDEFASRKK